MKGRRESILNVWFTLMYSPKWNCSFLNRIKCNVLSPRSYTHIDLYISRIGLPILLQGIYHSQTHQCGNWDWGRAIPRKRIHKWYFLAVWTGTLNYSRPGGVWLVTYRPGTEKSRTFFYSVYCSPPTRATDPLSLPNYGGNRRSPSSPKWNTGGKDQNWRPPPPSDTNSDLCLS